MKKKKVKKQKSSEKKINKFLAFVFPIFSCLNEIYAQLQQPSKVFFLFSKLANSESKVISSILILIFMLDNRMEKKNKFILMVDLCLHGGIVFWTFGVHKKDAG